VVSSILSPQYAPRNGELETIPIGEIPQVEETWAYWDLDYGMQNEWGLSIAESTATAMTVGWPASPDKTYGFCRVGIEDLSKIALERCKTARCAVQTMGDIAVEQGFYSADSGTPEEPAYGGSSEALVIGDAEPGELWIFNVLTGRNNASAIWAAQRVPSDHVVGIGNSFTIRALDLNDPENNLYSPNVTKLAEEMGWWSPSEAAAAGPGIFDFFSAYGYQPKNGGYAWDPPQVADVFAYYSGRRMWRIFSMLSPEEGGKLDPNRGNLPKTKNPYPPSVPAPRGSVTRSMIMDLLRDHYEGTPYDLTKGVAAGPYGNPNRAKGFATAKGQWERAISMHRTSFSFVLEAKPDNHSVAWFGYDAPHGSLWLPFFGAATKAAPEMYSGNENNMSTFNLNSAWWAFNLVNQYHELNFQLINAEVRPKANLILAEAAERLATWEQELDSHTASMDVLTDRSNDFAVAKVTEWWAFAWHLIAKYGRLVVTHNESLANGVDVVATEYSEDWSLKPEIGYVTWTPEGPLNNFACAAVDDTALSVSGLGNTGAIFVNSTLFGLVSMMVASLLVYTLGLRHGRQQATSQDLATFYSHLDA
jgi:dipeptidase